MAHIDFSYFDTLYAESGDPWSLQSRWYEQRKRALALACLPRRHFRSVFEPGCAGGDMTVELAGRADRVLAMDLHERALEQARSRLAGSDHVAVRQGVLPDDWPESRFDLIVLSEIGYYFTPASWAELIELAVDSLEQDGVLLVCHWRHDFDGRRQPTDAVHAAIGRAASRHSGLAETDGGSPSPRLFAQVDHVERDFVLQVWSCLPASAAQAEGLA